ncbi:MAG TPA: hypothetical protein DCL41_07460 [Bdellovibrionales bacterium]|nr:hypothetical protein [Pseudobdellovibrionaceae bacterium]HAG91692.1 hypothetical protein [Bdellovibrionales bacterium]|tara:strand:- start:1839 stop:2105 length:267 start_codon:yes stop_codon:yes gene_type:complete
MAAIARKQNTEVLEVQSLKNDELEKLKIRSVWVKLWSWKTPVQMLKNFVVVFFGREPLLRKTAPGQRSEEINSRTELARLDQFGGLKW